MSRVEQTHVDVFKAEPVGVWSAPGRVNLIGEHTDYNQGRVLPIALPHRTYAACSPREDRLLRVHSVQTGDTVEVQIDEVSAQHPGNWAAYVAGVVWALDQDGFTVGGMDITVDSDVPVGAGLSSSAALECSVGAACSDLFDLGLLADDEGRTRLAKACMSAENDIAGAPTGGMDQSAALLCHEGHALLLDCRSGATEQVPFDLDGAGLALLVTDTRAEHALNDGQYAARRESCDQAAAELGVTSLREVDPAGLDAALERLSDDVLRRRTRHVVSEVARVGDAVEALRAGDLQEVGRLFDASHASLRDDYEVSCEELDVSVEAARSAGALGARMTGGGFGGSSIALLPTGKVEAAQEAVRTAFAKRGWREPKGFVVTAGPAAHRDS